MATEGATYISDLTSNTPAGTASPAEGDDEIRQLKAVLKATLAGASGTGFAGAVTASHTELNLLDGAAAGTAVASKAAIYSSNKDLRADFFVAQPSGSFGINLYYDTAQTRWEYRSNGYGYVFYENSGNLLISRAAENSGGDGAAATVTPILTFASDGLGVTVSGSAFRIKADFSNATMANRLAFQSSTENGQTSVNAIPNGTSTQSQFLVVNNSNPTDSAYGAFVVTDAATIIRSGTFGTGTALPISFTTGTSAGSERLSISTGGDVTITGDQIAISNTQTPASASATGVKGTICWDTNYIYVCVATDTWKRVAIATWP